MSDHNREQAVGNSINLAFNGGLIRGVEESIGELRVNRRVDCFERVWYQGKEGRRGREKVKVLIVDLKLCRQYPW